MPQVSFVQPTAWILAGAGIQVSYSVAGPNFHYQDSQRILDFTGQEIRVVDVPDVGTLVSVTILLTVDSGSTTFTVLLPRVNLPPPPALPVAVPVRRDYDRSPFLGYPGFPERPTGILQRHPTFGNSALMADCNRKIEFIPDGADRAYQFGELLEGVRRDESKQPERTGAPDINTKAHVIVLIHGIRTRALWQNELRKALEKDGFVVQSTNCKYYDHLRFLFPWQLLAGPVVNDITKQIRHTLNRNEGASCSIIAHSFGTCVLTRILRDHTDLV